VDGETVTAPVSTRPAPIVRLGAWLLPRLVWTWPMRPARWLGRRLIDRTSLALQLGSPMLVGVLLTLLAWPGIRLGWWGKPVLTAWHNEEVARRNVLIIKRDLDRHGRVPLLTDFFWFSADEKERRRRDREQWEQVHADLKARLATEKAAIPWVLSPLAPRQPFPLRDFGWWLFYNMHHLLAGSGYPSVLLFYLVAGVISEWKGSERRRARRWRTARVGMNKERVLIGLDDDGEPHYLPQEIRNRHVLIAGTTGSGKTEALKLFARHDIAFGHGFVFVDMKGDRSLAEALFAAAVAVGRREDFLYLTFEPGRCHRYNAMATGDALAKRDRFLNACVWTTEAF
jgi:hypothetical protein